MPFASDIFPYDSFSENWTLERKGGLAKQLCRVS
jgi:hypothetical protein